VSIVAGVKLTLARNKAEDNWIGARANTRLRTDFREEEGVFAAQFYEAFPGGSRFELKQQRWPVEDGHIANCAGRGGGVFAFRSNRTIVNPIVEGLAKFSLRFNRFDFRLFILL
jgi:hypothetical protein